MGILKLREGYLNESSENFAQELADFIEENKGKKFSNEDVDKKFYNKILDRKNAGGSTNIKAVKDVYKLYQYYLIAKMIGNWRIERDCESVIEDTLSYKAWRDFEDMFSEIEYELPDYRVLKNAKIIFEHGNFYVETSDGIRYNAICDESEVEYKLLPGEIRLNGDSWKHFEYIKKATPGSISSKYSWKVYGKITLDKTTGEYHLSKVRFLLDCDSEYLYIVSRYTGLHNSAWVSMSRIGSGGGGTMSNSKWNKEYPYCPITRGTIYLFSEGRERIISKVRGDWDGYYNNISFEKLLKLLELADL